MCELLYITKRRQISLNKFIENLVFILFLSLNRLSLLFYFQYLCHLTSHDFIMKRPAGCYYVTSHYPNIQRILKDVVGVNQWLSKTSYSFTYYKIFWARIFFMWSTFVSVINERVSNICKTSLSYNPWNIIMTDVVMWIPTFRS